MLCLDSGHIARKSQDETWLPSHRVTRDPVLEQEEKPPEKKEESAPEAGKLRRLLPPEEIEQWMGHDTRT